MSDAKLYERLTCRVCGEASLAPFLDLGSQPPANALLREQDLALPEARFPLGLVHCPSCAQIQTTHVVHSGVLFPHYLYFSSVSGAMGEHFARYAAEVVERYVPPQGLFVEFGSNDGILLRSLRDRPVRILGVDPAANVAEQARASGVPTLTAFFGEQVARGILREHGPAMALVGNNVLAHIDDLDDVMQGADVLLDERGVLVVEVPSALRMVEHNEFDTVYHEHLSYFGLATLARLFARFGFEVVDSSEQAVHGGTLRVFAQRKGVAAPTAAVARLLELERSAGLQDVAVMHAFARRVVRLRDEIRALVFRLHDQGARLAGYTAPAKGNVLLNYCDLTPHVVRYLADATPAKQGLYSPGVRLPIRTPEDFREDAPDYALLLAWNHRDEVLRREAAWRARGGRFIVCIPGVEIL